MKILTESKDGKYIFILAEGDAPCINSKIKYNEQDYRVLSCRSFVHDSNKFKATLMLETPPSKRHIIIK